MLKRQLITLSSMAVGILASSAFLIPAVFAQVEIIDDIIVAPDPPIYGSPYQTDGRLSYYDSNFVTVPKSESKSVNKQCPAGTYVVSGGFETKAVGGNLSNGFSLIHSFPSNQRQWTVRVRNADDIDRDVKVYVVCLKAN